MPAPRENHPSRTEAPATASSAPRRQRRAERTAARKVDAVRPKTPAFIEQEQELVQEAAERRPSRPLREDRRTPATEPPTPPPLLPSKAAFRLGSNAFDFGAVDPGTGTFTKLSTLSGIAPVQGTAAIDRQRGLYYQVDKYTTFDTSVRTVDVATGGVVNEAKTDRQLFELEVTAEGKLVAVVMEGQRSELCTVSPSTGLTTVVATLPSWRLTQGLSAIDRDAGILYLPFATGPESTDFQLGEVELATGRATAVPLVRDFDMLEVCSMCQAPTTD